MTMFDPFGHDRFEVNLRRLDLECGHCENRELGVAYEQGPHFRLDCRSCGSYIKFVSKPDLEGASSEYRRVAERG